MSKALRYRLLRIGKMPAEWKEAATASGVLLAAEGISVKESVRSLRMPRAQVSQGTRLLVGSLVVRPDRLLASIDTHPILDTSMRSPSGVMPRSRWRMTACASASRWKTCCRAVVDRWQFTIGCRWTPRLSRRFRRPGARSRSKALPC